MILSERPVDQRRAHAMAILRAATDAVEPAAAVLRAVHRDGDCLVAGNRCYNLRTSDHVFVVGAGKATAAMAAAMEELLGDDLTAGAINVKATTRRAPQRIRVQFAGHPLPDAAGVAGTREIVQLVDQAGPRDLVICLLSGGGSSLLVSPVPPITLAEKQALTASMLRRGCTINEMNAVRKHISEVKGGQLARRAAPADVLTLLVSDVIATPLDVIASGPTAADESCFADALAVLDRHDLRDSTPRAIRDHLEAGSRGEQQETPKAGDPALQRVHHLVVASNELACNAAIEHAKSLGYHPLLLSSFIEGEAREVARVLVGVGRQIALDGRPIPMPACVVAGGETTVTVRGRGTGGRNQELALSAAIRLHGNPRVLVASYATDGDDGPTDAAGAIVDGGTVDRMASAGHDAEHSLRDNDAYPALDVAGDLLRTGPSGTNVNDLMLVLVDTPHAP